jgi:hypothetical protein
MRLKYTIGRVVLVLVSPLLCHSPLTLLPEAKLALVTISPTIVTMKSHKLRFRLGLQLLTLFLSTSCSTGFSSLGFSPSFPKNTFPTLLLKLIGFWKSFVE